MIDSTSWQSALLELFGGTFSFAAAGPRRHEDWRRDVQAVMALEASDPRKWGFINCPPPTSNVEKTEMKPFADLRVEEFDALLYRVGWRSATQLLVALQGLYYQAANIPDFEARKQRLFDCAELILSRFQQEAAYYTNAAEARGNSDPDLLNPDTEWNRLSDFTTDCGLIVVADSEVGVFWAFDED
ncbi:hypothetical protein AB0F30_27315 [Streptomyces sp. NPDC029006]|uniref:hypothetical protein n=1 Tax=Streptomyces sp. NPDC029006 TaxID=3155467 RepID=UPI0034091AE1